MRQSEGLKNLAAKRMKVPMIVPMLATRSIEDVAHAAGPDTVLWFQVYFVQFDYDWWALEKSKKIYNNIFFITDFGKYSRVKPPRVFLNKKNKNVKSGGG